MPEKKTQQLSGRARISDAPARLWPRYVFPIAGVWAVALAAYSNSFAGGFVFDNVPIVQNDPRIRAATAENIRHIFTGEYWFDSQTSGLYRPLTTLSYLFHYAVLGDASDPAAYHAVNLTLHCLNIALAYTLGLAILGDAFAALALAALWAVHPALVESVTNIVGRADLLAGFGVLAGLLCYVRQVSSTGRKRIVWLAALAARKPSHYSRKRAARFCPSSWLCMMSPGLEPRRGEIVWLPTSSSVFHSRFFSTCDPCCTRTCWCPSARTLWQAPVSGPRGLPPSK